MLFVHAVGSTLDKYNTRSRAHVNTGGFSLPLLGQFIVVPRAIHPARICWGSRLSSAPFTTERKREYWGSRLSPAPYTQREYVGVLGLESLETKRVSWEKEGVVLLQLCRARCPVPGPLFQGQALKNLPRPGQLLGSLTSPPFSSAVKVAGNVFQTAFCQATSSKSSILENGPSNRPSSRKPLKKTGLQRHFPTSFRCPVPAELEPLARSPLGVHHRPLWPVPCVLFGFCFALTAERHKASHSQPVPLP